ncbi:hypothetical protein UPYG_G00062410 [Umbra pygmaea]|uniref:Uncharacterized protein n=1 Tax=Umbra pygmaea TaxID=75934 RepID=A0ABD0XX38_UMBPY
MALTSTAKVLPDSWNQSNLSLEPYTCQQPTHNSGPLFKPSCQPTIYLLLSQDHTQAILPANHLSSHHFTLIINKLHFSSHLLYHLCFWVLPLSVL